MSLDLSVCLATFNRGEYIGATLESIVSQATEQTEIVIIDGGSTDRTAAVVREWQARFPRIRYQRQTENGGFDRDLAAALDLASGRYLWMYSDDDPMKPGAVAAVLAHLDEGHALIVVNAEVRNRDLSRVLDRRRLRTSHDRVYPPVESEDFFRTAADYLTFVGAIVLRRDVWVSSDRARWFGTMFVHTAVLFEKTLPGTALVLAEPRVIIRYGQAMWTARGFDIWMFKWPDLVWSFPFSDVAKRAVTPREPWRRLRNLVLHRAMGSYGPEQFEKLAPGLRGSARWASRLVAMLPPRALNLFLTLAAIVILRRRSTTLTDLRNSRFAPFQRR